jgi:hypothetical protein
VALVLAVAVSGCSFFFQPAARDASCTPDRREPMVDGIIAGVGALGGLALIVHAQTSDDDGSIALYFFGLTALFASLPYAVSALSGKSTNDECRRLRALPPPPLLE